MTDSGIKDICSDPQFAILKVEQKFQAVMDDEQAEEHFLNLIDESVSALLPVLLELGHKISIAMQWQVHADGQSCSAADSQAEEDFRKAVLQLAVTGGGWPADFKRRLRHILERRCQAKTVCAEAPKPVEAEIDFSFTSPRARSSGSTHQALLSLGEMTGIPLFKARADVYRSEGPSVVLTSASIAQSRDCFAFRGANSSLALRLAPGDGFGVSARQLVIEQPARWAALRPRSAPRRFAVFGLPASTGRATTAKVGEGPYTEFLGSFEYAAAGPAAQAFELPSTMVEGLRLVFSGPEWGESYICLYRVKVFEESGTVCSGRRIAAVLPRL
ncbi:unnamed protein product [Symbiodinium necroappetens]|uniref:SUN domain-containing protein n=1 Tax=Symbiodinium necroappetens TaxID=1628268 RepID=A0A812VXK3_9DINO|nr:unnamed protein product [Symbiodinium necroappetens]